MKKELKRLFLTFVICLCVTFCIMNISTILKRISTSSSPISTQSFSIPIYEKDYYLEQIIPLDPDGENWKLVYRRNKKELKIQVKLKVETTEDIRKKVRLGVFEKEK